MASVGIPPALRPLMDIQHAAEMTAQFLYAGAAIYLYDWFLTFPYEVEFIWYSSWSAVKTLFLINRYATPLVLLTLIIGDGGVKSSSLIVCKILFITGGVAMSLLFIIWNWILAIRVHALYGLNIRVKYFLAFLWIATSSTTLGLTLHQMIVISRGVVTIKDLKVCLPQTLPSNYFSIWLPGTCYETILFIMTISQLFVMMRNRTSKTSLHTLLLRDGTLNYIVLTSARIVNLIMYIRKDPMNIYMVLFLTIGLGSTLVSRMVINLRSWNRIPEYPDLPLDGLTHSKRHMGSGDVSNMFELATRRTGGGSRSRSRSRGDPYDVDYDDETRHSDKPAHLHSRSVHIDIGGRPTYRRQGSMGPLQVQKRNSLLQHQQRSVGVVVEKEIITSADSVHFEDAVPLPPRTGSRDHGRGRAFQARTGAGRDIEMFDDESSLDGEDGEGDRDGKKRPLDSLKDFFGPNGPKPPT